MLCSTQRTLPSNSPNTASTHVFYATTTYGAYIVFRCKRYLGAMGLMACMGSKSCCDTCCVGTAWVGFGVLADLGIGSVGNGLALFGCAVLTFTPSMSRASSAIIVAIKRSTSKRTAACSSLVMLRIAFSARCTSAKALTVPPPYLQNHHPKTVSTCPPKTAARFFYVQNPFHTAPIRSAACHFVRACSFSAVVHLLCSNAKRCAHCLCLLSLLPSNRCV